MLLLQMFIIWTLKIVLIFTFAEEKTLLNDNLTFGLPWKHKFGNQYYFLFIAFVDRIWIILNLYELLIYTFAESR